MEMKQFINIFKENFNNFKYDEDSIDILLNMIDSILEMMQLTDFSDTITYMKKLNSFLKLISAEYCSDILNIDTIQKLYKIQILPILNYLEKKYDPYSSVEAINKARQSIEKSKEISVFDDTMIKLEDLDETSYKDLISFYNIKFKENEIEEDELSIESIRGYSNLQLFNLLKSASHKLIELYNSYIYGDYDKISILRYLQKLKFTTGITKNNSHHSVRWISETIHNTCKILLSLVDTDCIPVPATSGGIKLQFEFMNELQYVES